METNSESFQIPTNDEFLEKVGKQQDKNWEKCTTFQKNRFKLEIRYWIEVLNENI